MEKDEVGIQLKLKRRFSSGTRIEVSNVFPAKEGEHNRNWGCKIGMKVGDEVVIPDAAHDPKSWFQTLMVELSTVRPFKFIVRRWPAAGQAPSPVLESLRIVCALREVRYWLLAADTTSGTGIFRPLTPKAFQMTGTTRQTAATPARTAVMPPSSL